MKYLILGDVHGNLPALEKILKIEKNNYENLLTIGDIVNYGPWSNECVQLLNSLNNTIHLKGNHENYFLNSNYPGSNIIAKSFFEKCFHEFTEFECIKNYIDNIDIGNFFVTHTINDKYIFFDTDLSDLSIDKNYIISHSHQQFERIYNRFKIINSGSAGQNRQFINIGNYILFDISTNNIEFKYVKLDIDILINELYNKKYNDICINYYKNKARV